MCRKIVILFVQVNNKGYNFRITINFTNCVLDKLNHQCEQCVFVYVSFADLGFERAGLGLGIADLEYKTGVKATIWGEQV